MSNINKLVAGATKPKSGPIKSKYTDPILATTFAADNSLTQVCKALSSRLAERDPIVAYKALIIIHLMIRNGAVENVLSHIAQDETGSRLKALAGRGGGNSTSNAPRIVRAYAGYLDDRVRAYRELRHDVIRSSDSSRNGGGATSNRLRRLNVEKGLLREVGITQKVGNAILNCDFFLEDLRDDLNLAASRMCFKDVLALYASINEGVINILEHYFEMAKTDAERALELYRRFCSQTEKVVAYMGAVRKAADTLALNVPSLKHAPTSLSGALKEYLDDPNFEKNRLEYKENKRIADGGAPSKPAVKKEEAKEVKKEDTDKEAEKKKKEEEKPAVKPPTSNQALQDFFASIDDNSANNMFSMGPQDAWLGAYGMQAQQTGFPNGGGLAPQMTGFNPFMPQMMAPQQTGFPGAGGMMPQQQFMQPQMTGASPFMQPQQTGFNPFRQSMMMQPTGASPFGTPFGMSQTGMGQQQQQQQFQQSQAPQQQQSQQPQQQPTQAAQPQTTGLPGSSSLSTLPSSNSFTSAAPTSSAPAKPLLPQQTGSRNPFAPPPGSTPPPELPKATGPTLAQLASGAFGQAGPAGGNYGLGAGAWDGKDPTKPDQGSVLKPQQTGLMGSVASEFTSFGSKTANGDLNAGASAAHPFGQSNGGTTGLESNFTGLAVNSSQQANAFGAPSPSPLTAQPTGFGGVKPFKPESSFGANLAGNLAFQIPNSSAPGASALSPQLTSNPFARPNGTPDAGLPSSTSATGSSLFGSNPLSSNATGSTLMLSGQPTGFPGSGITSPSLGAQPTGLGSSLFGNGSNAAPHASTQFSTSFSPAQTSSSLPQTNGAFAGTPSALTAQPTGFAGSAIKPFQPTSAFGTAAFGAVGSGNAFSPQQQQQQHPQAQQQQQQPNFLL